MSSVTLEATQKLSSMKEEQSRLSLLLKHQTSEHEDVKFRYEELLIDFRNLTQEYER